MDIGKKIKELRTAKLMTQTELAGHEITRNMLSRIENGAALPSVGTVIYLSERLGVHPGVLLSDGDDDLVFVKNNLLKNIKRALTDKNFSLCRDMCKELLAYGDDDEISLIMSEATLKYAESQLLCGGLHKCKYLLDEAILYSQKTIYDTKVILSCAKNIFFHLKKISPSLDSDSIDCQRLDAYCESLSFGNELCRYLNTLSSIWNSDKGDSFDVSSDMLVGISSELYKNHIIAKIHMKKGDFVRAFELLSSAINMEGDISVFTVYLLSGDIEICAREMGDYKTAYEYSTNRISLLESMLSEV